VFNRYSGSTEVLNEAADSAEILKSDAQTVQQTWRDQQRQRD
jgi:hypothetical protein